MNSRGWQLPDDYRSDDLRALARRARSALPPLHPRDIGIGLGAILMLILLLSSWYTVQPEQTAIVQRFGRVVRTAGPGLHFKIPYGVERVRQANRELPKARGEAARTITEAEGYALARVNRAKGEAERFRAVLAEYQGARDVTRRRLYLEALGDVLPKARAIYIVDGDQKALVPWLSVGSAGASGAASPPLPDPRGSRK
jgi:regulator of protease activity HflC (stomatin/prohibitin superfamily)